MKNQKAGFTIVELLIVIVVIAILAAITIVAYNGIQSRAKTTSAQSAAQQVTKKAQIYNTEVGRYPLSMTILTGAASTQSYHLTGVVHGGTLSNDTPTNGVTYYICGTGSPTDASQITAANISGGIAYYRNYGESSNRSVTVGVTSGSGVACYGTT